MYNYLFSSCASTLILISACSKNNSISQNSTTNDKRTPGLFSRDSEKGISLSDILFQTSLLASIIISL